MTYSNPVDDPRLTPESSPTLEVLGALRDMLAENLGLKRRLIGGWEVVAERDATLAVYTNGGTDHRGAGSQVTRTSEELSIVFMARSGSPMHEKNLYPVRDAVRQLLVRFQHPHLAGIGETSWTFDLRRDGGFTNILTIKARLDYRSRPVQMRTEDTLLVARAREVVASLTHVATDGKDTP